MAWYAGRLLDFVLPLPTIKRILMDRGFYDFKLMYRLRTTGLRFIALTPYREEYQATMKRGEA
jgi:hypothetical protein